MITSQKRVLVGILVIGIITATITTLAVTKVFNLVAAQSTSSSASSSAAGPHCNGCITTQNLANGAVTNPKLAVPSVSSANIGAGQVATANIADSAVTTSKISPGAVSMSVQEAVDSRQVNPGATVQVNPRCPSGSIVTGGGFVIDNGLEVTNDSPVTATNGWNVIATNHSTNLLALYGYALCATIHP